MITSLDVDFFDSESHDLEILTAPEIAHDEDTEMKTTGHVIEASFLIRTKDGRTFPVTSEAEWEEGMTLESAMINATIKARRKIKAKEKKNGHD